ncbi:hypothetical protein PR048_014503 [Dryococelus australis]|uniref:Uncharacterized protein n=1 Tax=Dryococelus australis TaxID=614101 RepID=A0ABQ9HED1_9NEOP|nr:hypothetical protein PR048_014503 [Dryococelus australis]
MKSLLISCFRHQIIKKSQSKKITGLDEFDEVVVRHTINNLYLVNKCLPQFVYLKKITPRRSEARPMDETNILSSRVTMKGWLDDSTLGISTQISKGNRLIVMHAGGEMGLIKDCLVSDVSV